MPTSRKSSRSHVVAAPSLLSLDSIRVASPCSADWNAMPGDERVRFCGSCQKNVYDLSAMTRPEAQALIFATEGNLCAQFYRRADGTILTRDCPIGLLQADARLRGRTVLTWHFASLLTLCGALLSGALAMSSEPPPVAVPGGISFTPPPRPHPAPHPTSKTTPRKGTHQTSKTKSGKAVALKSHTSKKSAR